MSADPVTPRETVYRLWTCPECDYHGIEGVTGGVGPWPGDGKVRCPSRRCEYATVMQHVGALAPVAVKLREALQAQLHAMVLHDETGDPHDEGYMAAIDEMQTWLDGAA